MINIHGFSTGLVQITYSQIVSEKRGGLIEVLTDKQWSEWLPIAVWLIEHPEGLILVDTGETARTMTPGYLPRFHPYYLWACRFDVRPEDEIGPQLERAGFDPKDIRHVIMTHMHTDHAGGLRYFPVSTIWVDEPEMEAASGFMGRVNGYINRHYPEWFAPRFYQWTDKAVGPFDRSAYVTNDDSVAVVPTPGHSAGHVSVIVRGAEGERPIVLGGDITDETEAMFAGKGGALLAPVGFESLAKMAQFVEETDAVMLPAHEIGVIEKLHAAVG